MPSRARPINPRTFTGDTSNNRESRRPRSVSRFHQTATRVAVPPEGDVCRGSTRRRRVSQFHQTTTERRSCSTRRGPGEARVTCADGGGGAARFVEWKFWASSTRSPSTNTVGSFVPRAIEESGLVRSKTPADARSEVAVPLGGPPHSLLLRVVLLGDRKTESPPTLTELRHLRCHT